MNRRGLLKLAIAAPLAAIAATRAKVAQPAAPPHSEHRWWTPPQPLIFCDPAIYGNETTTIAVFDAQTGQILSSKQWRRGTVLAITQRCCTMARAWGARSMIVDPVGIGQGIVDRARECGLHVIEARHRRHRRRLT